MRTGPEVYAELSAAERALRARADADARALHGVQARAHELIAQRADATLALARHYVPSLDDDVVARAFAEVRGELAAVQAERTQRIAALRARIDEAAGERAARERELAALTAQLDELVRRRGELEAKVAARLRDDAEFQTLAAAAAGAEAQLAQNEERAAELKREAAEKLPSYDQSALFRYLWQRRFGTAEYRGGGLSQRLDRWVADLIDYGRARPSYEFLQVTPRLVEQEVTRRREGFQAAMHQVEAREDQAADDEGLTPVLREGERLGAERDRLVAAMTAEQRAHAALCDELAAAERKDGEFWAAALGRMRAFLERTATAVLAERARSTPDAKDDAMVADLARLEAEIDALRPEIEAMAARRAATEERAIGAERMVRRFREAGYDGPRARFDGLEPGEPMARYQTGAVGLDDAWQQIQRAHRLEAAATGPFAGPADFGRGAGTSAGGDVSRVLLQVMGHVVGAALSGAARGSVMRRGSFPDLRRASAGRPRMGGGFTRGKGF